MDLKYEASLKMQNMAKNATNALQRRKFFKLGLLKTSLHCQRQCSNFDWSIVYVCVCCHSNEIRTLIANLPNSAQLGGIPYHSPKLHSGQ